MDGYVPKMDEKAREKFCRNDKSVWTEEKLMRCLERIVHKDIFSQISKIDVLQFTTSTNGQFDNDVVKRYLEYLIKKPDFRLQTYCRSFDKVDSLLFDLISLQKVPLFYKYVKLQQAAYLYSEPLFLANENQSEQLEYISKNDVVLLFYQKLKEVVGEEEARKVCDKHFERLEGCYELLIAFTFKMVVASMNDISANHAENFLHSEILKANNLIVPAPILRLFCDEQDGWCFSKEVEIAMRAAFRNRYPNKSLPTNWNQQKTNNAAKTTCWDTSVFIRHDNEEDRALGILHIVEKSTVENLLKSLNLAIADIHVLIIKKEDFQREYSTLPVVSPYGSHCKLAAYSYIEFIDSLVMDMRLFQRIKRSNLHKIEEYIGKFSNIFDDKRYYRYVIESWKLDEMKKQAHEKLKGFLVKPIYNIPLKPSFTKREVIEESKMFVPVLNLEHFLLEQWNCREIPTAGYSYSEICEAFVDSITKHFMGKFMKQFFGIQFSRSDVIPVEIFQRFDNGFKKTNVEVKLPPCLKFGTNDLGEVRAPKNKKNIKPDFSKKIDKEAVLMELVKCLNLNFEKLKSFDIGHLAEYFTEEELQFLNEVLESEEKRKEIEDVFDIEVNNGVYTLKRKTAEYFTEKIIEKIQAEKSLKENVRNLENDKKLKEVEIEKLDKKRTELVSQSMEAIRKSRKEKDDEVQRLRNDIEVLKKENEDIKKNFTTQIKDIKQDKREKLNKFEEGYKKRGIRIQQLEEKLKESAEELREEREKKSIQANEQLKIANKNMEKMKVELEDLKFWKNSRTKEIAELKGRVEELEAQIEDFEKQNSEQHVETETEEKEISSTNILPNLNIDFRAPKTH